MGVRLLVIAAVIVIARLRTYFAAVRSGAEICHRQGHRRADRAVGHRDRDRESGDHGAGRHLRVGADRRDLRRFQYAGQKGPAVRENRSEHLPGHPRYRAGDAGERAGAARQGPGRPRLQEGHLRARPATCYKDDAVSKDAVDRPYSAWQMDVAQVELDQANIQQQTGQRARRRRSISNYTNIVSPVDGTVVSRNVDVGQTVAASFQTPTLFLIAQDLTKMQVDTNVSESDIGYVQVGQKATFTVDAFPDRDFEGVGRAGPAGADHGAERRDLRRGGRVENPELLLKPGMTANVNVVTASKRDNVLRVPIDALRFSPPGQPPADSAAIDGAPGRQTPSLGSRRAQGHAGHYHHRAQRRHLGRSRRAATCRRGSAW